MAGFYCTECGDILDDPDEDACSFCREIDDMYCAYCGVLLPANESGVCDDCQVTVDTDMLDEDDEEFLRGPFRN